MAIIARFLNWLLTQSNRLGPNLPAVFPVKWTGIVFYSGKRLRVKVAIRHDTDWDTHFLRSFRNKGYWYHSAGNKYIGTLQLMDVIAEWRIGKYVGKP